MKKELKDDEELAARAEQELRVRQEAERSWAKLRAIEGAKVRMAAAGEQHTCTQTVSTLMKQTNAAGQKQLSEAILRGVSRDRRRLYHQGLLSKQNSGDFTNNLALRLVI